MTTLRINDLSEYLWTVLLLSAMFLGTFLFAYRRRIVSVFDPLVLLAMAQTAQCVLALSYIHSQFLLFQFFASQAALVVGFLLIPTPPRTFAVQETAIAWTDRDVVIAERTVGILFLMVVAANIWLAASGPLPLFTNDPVNAKFTVYTGGGLGLVRRVNYGIGIFVPAGALLLAAKGKHKVLFAFLFAACMPIAAVGGSKGPLLMFLQLIGYVLYRRDLLLEKMRKRLRLVSVILVGLSIFLGIFVLYILMKDWQLATLGLLERLLYTGDTVMYYYDPRVFPAMKSFGPIDFVSMLLNPITGLLRIAPYRAALGHWMILEYMNYSPIADDIAGPNTSFYAVGNIYFGAFFGVIYCGAVGYFLAFIRGLFLRSRNASPLRLSWFLTLAVLVYNLPNEVNLFTGPLLDIAWMVLVAFIAAHISLLIFGAASLRIRPFQSVATVQQLVSGKL